MRKFNGRRAFDRSRIRLCALLTQDSGIAMLNFVKNEEERPERKALREGFSQLTKTLRNSDDLSQMVAGNSINVANSSFLQTHSSAEGFRSLPKQEQLEYIDKLSAIEHELSETDPEAALGYKLFKMWVEVLAANDDELIEIFSKELAHFGEKGDLPLYF